MRNYFAQISAIKNDGTYLIEPDGISNYAERWAYGYIVAIRGLDIKDLDTYTLFGIWTDDEGHKQYDLVRHIGAYQDAVKFAQDHEQNYMYDLREGKVVSV